MTSTTPWSSIHAPSVPIEVQQRRESKSEPTPLALDLHVHMHQERIYADRQQMRKETLTETLSQVTAATVEPDGKSVYPQYHGEQQYKAATRKSIDEYKSFQKPSVDEQVQ